CRKCSPTAELDELCYWRAGQAGKGTLAEKVPLLHVPQATLINDQTEYLIQVDDNKNDVPLNAGVHSATGHSEVQDLKQKPDYSDDAQPKNIRHPVGECNENIRHMPWDIGPVDTPLAHTFRPRLRWLAGAIISR